MTSQSWLYPRDCHVRSQLTATLKPQQKCRLHTANKATMHGRQCGSLYAASGNAATLWNFMCLSLSRYKRITWSLTTLPDQLLQTRLVYQIKLVDSTRSIGGASVARLSQDRSCSLKENLGLRICERPLCSRVQLDGKVCHRDENRGSNTSQNMAQALIDFQLLFS